MAKEQENELEKFPSLSQKLLATRGIATLSEAEKFLHPDWQRDSFDPFLILNMEKAVARILLAMKNAEKIIVYTDYDCDGIPAGVILRILPLPVSAT